MDLARWADDLIDFVRDFVQDTNLDIEAGATPRTQTEDEWWEAFLTYREATGS